jgi:Uma2 family endonuclease
MPEELSMAATAVLETLNPASQTEPEKFDDDVLYEDVDGQRIERRPMSYYAGMIATELVGDLIIHVRGQSPVPGMVAHEVIFRLPLPEGGSGNRRPDLAFVSCDRWPIDRPMSSRENAWDVVPDLAVEVTSPTDYAAEQLRKVREYFHAGVRLVWIVYPDDRCVHVYEAWNQIRVVRESDTLDGGVALPSFRLPLDRLFGPVEPVTDGE